METSALLLIASLRAKPSVNLLATLHSAELSMVAFSRSISPIEPISLEMETCTSWPTISRHNSAALSSWSFRTVENTLEMATDSTCL